MALTTRQALAVDTVLRWVTGVAPVGDRLPSTDEAMNAAALLALAATRTRTAGVMTAAQVADRWPATPRPGERASTVAAAVSALQALADDLRGVTEATELLPAGAVVEAVEIRARAMHTEGATA